MTTKKKDSAASRIVNAALSPFPGMPTPEEVAELAEQENTRPVDDVDFFDYIEESFVKKGVRVEFSIRKDGNWLTTLRPPLNFELLRKQCGSGHFVILAKNATTKKYIGQKTETIEEFQVEESDSGDSSPFFGGRTEAMPDGGLTSIISLMQQQDQRRADQAREDRTREEDRRRDERERDETRRREERENRTTFLQTIMTALPGVLPLLLPKKDESPFLEIMKDNMRNQELQNQRMMDRLEKLAAAPVAPQTSALDLIKQLNDARKDGREEMKELMEMVDEKAEIRAEELAASGGEKEDSTLTTMIKSLGPSLMALASSRGAPPALAPPEAAEGTEQVVESQPAQAPSSGAAPSRSATKKPSTKNEQDQAAVLKIVLPFLGDQFVRMGQNHSIDPKAAARETLQLLKTKGFTQARVVELFSKEALMGVLRAYQVPKEYDPWFNGYYEALVLPETQAPLRDRSKTVSLARGSGKPSPRDGAQHVPAASGSPAPKPVVLSAAPDSVSDGAKQVESKPAEILSAPSPGHLPGKPARGPAEVTT